MGGVIKWEWEGNVTGCVCTGLLCGEEVTMCGLREWCGRTYIWMWVCVRCTVGATKRGDDSGRAQKQ